jgi:glycosyltransferase involved in cell wall biosynthesis
MRIAVVNSFFPPRVGGSAHLSNALAEAYARAGHDVSVLTAAYRDAPAFEERDGLRIHRLPAAIMREIRYLSVSFDIAFTLRPSVGRRVAAILDEFGPDVLHQHGQFFDLTWVTGLWARRRQVPVLLSVHTRLESPSIPYAIAFRLLDKGIVAPTMRRYRPRFVVMDTHMDSYIRSRYRRGIGGLESIPVGVHAERLATGDASIVRDRHGLGKCPLILSIGHVIPLRNRIALVESLPGVRQAIPDVRLVVVGHVYCDAFLQRARQLGVDDLIVTTGAVPSTDIPHYLAAAAVESHDLQGYGLGTASLESMGAGVPVVAAVRPDNFPGVDLVSGQNCWLVPVGDTAALGRALIGAITDEAARNRVSAKGRALVLEHFTMDTVLSRHLEVLNEMVKTARE